MSYTGVLFPGNEEMTLCPKCIVSGRASYKTRKHLIDPLYCSSNVDFEELSHKTVPYHWAKKEAPIWTFHCDSPCVYLGKVEPEDLNDYLWGQVLDNWNHSNNLFSDINNTKIIRNKIARFEVEAHLFKCPICQGKLMFFEYTDHSKGQV